MRAATADHAVPDSTPATDDGRPRTDDARAAQLALRWQQHGDQRARAELFERYLPLARRLAARYRNPHEPLEDLVQVAAVGLLGAVDRFQPERGAGFRAFAVPTILGELKRYFRNTGWSAHVPRGSQELALRVDRAFGQLLADSGRTPRVEELAQFLELDAAEVLAGLEAGSAHYAVSLDAPVGGSEEDGPELLGESLGNEDDRFGLVEAELSLTAAIRVLAHQERQALTLRIERQLTQSEIAHELGCSQMQVSRLLGRATSRLRELTDPQ
ncbi:MAG: sigma-70 family RNA polymerase sigma factor [Solirubrobacteraceae bacterium]